MDFDKLSAMFPPEDILWRVGATTGDKKSGLALAYLDARHVMERLDSVCGPENWQCKYPIAAEKTCCEIGIKIADEWVWKGDGAGDTEVESAKGAFSDAFKRAGVKWGIGRYLYDMPNIWVKITARGRSQVIADDEYPRLQKAVAQMTSGKPVDIESGTPANSRDPRWTGPLKKTELQAKCREIVGEITSCSDYNQLVAYQNSKEVNDVIIQLEKDMVEWLDHTPDEDGKDYWGIKQHLEMMGAQLINATESNNGEM